MNTSGIGWRVKLRLIWTVAAKDILEALKNKNTLTVILSALFVVMMYRLIPVITGSNDLPYLRVYAAEENSLLTRLKDSGVFQVRTYPSEERMLEVLRNGDTPELGLVIPAGYEQRVAAGQSPVIQGYVLRWVSAAEADGLSNQFKAALPGPVVLSIDQVGLTPDSGGLGVWAGLSLVFTLVMVAISLIPHLMLEEKQSRTMDVLRVSPASAWDLAAAKAVAGMFYSLTGAAVCLALYSHLIVHWGLALLAILCGSFFSVMVGLCLGLMFNNRAQLTIWAWVVIVPLLIPIFFALQADLLPPLLGKISGAIPTAVMFNLLRGSFANPVSWGQSLLGAAYVTGWGLLVAGGVVWQVRRLDREGDSIGGRLSGWLARIAGKGAGITGSKDVILPQGGDVSGSQAEVDVSIPSGYVAAAPGGLKIIAAVFAKDLREIIKNKVAISILIGTVLMIVPGVLFPALVRTNQDPIGLVVDEGRSVIISELISSQQVRLSPVLNRDVLEMTISQSPNVIIGLEIPAEFDQKMKEGQTVRIAGYAAHWADQKQVAEWAAYFAEKISQAGLSKVVIDPTGNLVYPSAETSSGLNMTALLLVMVIFTMGIALVPLLVVEEKEAHTLEAILVSPVNLAQLVVGKALAGAVYCLIAAGVVLAVNNYLVVNWGVVLLAVLLTTFFAVAIGLLVGVVSNNPTNVGLWSFLSLLVLVAMIFAHFYVNPAWPEFVRGILTWLPGSLMIQIVRFSLAGSFPVDQLWANSFALVGMAGLLLAAAGLLIRRTMNR